MGIEAHRTTTAIVGGGAAGTLCAIALLRQPSPTLRRVILIEESDRVGEGVAYATTSASHLLNVRANGMSALPDAPDDFVDWANRQGLAVSGPEFLPRRLYGRYLRDTLAAAQAAAAPGTLVEHRQRRVIDMCPCEGRSAFTLRMLGGDELVVDQVVLATGQHATPVPWLPNAPQVVTDPWQAGRIEALSELSTVLIVGTGLTAIDVTLSMRDAGYRGAISLVSSHGLLPEPHAEQVLPPRSPAVRPGDGSARSIRGLVRALRTDAAFADDWRQTVDGMREDTVDLWRELPLDEKRRALRHVSRRWEVRRHRMAPEIVASVDSLRAAGTLSVGRGRLTGLSLVSQGLRATLVDRGVERTLDVDGFVLCTGLSADPRHDPLMSRLIASGLAVRHPLGLGLDVDTDGRVRRADGCAWPNVFAVGSTRRGADWESTAVPELRAQAQEIATSLANATPN